MNYQYSFEYGGTYYWQVVASDGNGGETEGPIWSFGTLLPAFTIADISINKESLNQDLALNPGEKVDLGLSIRNNTAFRQPMIHAWISSDSEYVDITRNFAQINVVEPGDIDTLIKDFQLKIDPATPAGEVITFELRLLSRGGHSEEVYLGFTLTVV